MAIALHIRATRVAGWLIPICFALVYSCYYDQWPARYNATAASR